MTNAISPSGLALIQEFEGFRAEPAQLPDGNWVVGYGHVRIGDAGAPVTQSEAADLLALDLAPVERLVNAAVTQVLTQSQFDALVSFAFSVGAEAFVQSQVARRANAGDFVSAACAMDAWRKSDVSGELEIVDALVRRRAGEKALFLKELPHDASPSVFMRARLDYAASVLGAPTKYAAAPAVGSIPVAQPRPEPVQRLGEILKSEPATEALLLTQVAPEQADEDEIVTAHAKPVARSLDSVRDATRRAYAEQAAKRERGHQFDFIKPDHRIRNMRRRAELVDRVGRSFENLGLIALFVFGLGLIAVGASFAFGGDGGAIEVAGASALIAPGLAAALMAGFGLWRGGAHAQASA
jgi:GH24 family phage-related lysozyme (muramidase)